MLNESVYSPINVLLSCVTVCSEYEDATDFISTIFQCADLVSEVIKKKMICAIADENLVFGRTDSKHRHDYSGNPT
ncbi:hypothetical protein YC2023_091081 [Brassica napus]